MMVLITYDVDTTSDTGKKRLRKVAKECQNYGQRVQNSVFECLIDESQFVALRNKLKMAIDERLDSLRFYFMGNNWERKIETLGKITSYNMTEELII